MRFLEHIVEEGLLPRQALEEAMRRHGRKEKSILEELSRQSTLDPNSLLLQLSSYYKLPIVDIDSEERDPAAMRLIPFEIANRYGVFPLKVSKDTLIMAVSDPSDFFMGDDLRAVSGCRIDRVLSSAKDIRTAIEKYYRVDEYLNKAVQDLSLLSGNAGSLGDRVTLHSLEDSHAPVSKAVQRILENAAQLNASDIHFEPQENTVDLRYRIDGELSTIQSLPCQSYSAIVARIKILTHMDIAEQRKPQDGRARLTFRGRKIDLRVSTLPTMFGEKVVARLLNQDSLAVDSLDSLGLDPSQQEIYLKAINSKQGIVLVTGPTGSGKTTTLYASINQIKSERSNITTIEDPIEYLLTGVNQSQINPKIGVTFSNTLRSILRQDPDVIFVGEIRDRETADIAFRSSLTGHLVFTTLHTNGAVNTISRLLDLGLEPYLVGSALLCIVAQRLVRVICPDCREAYRPDRDYLELFKGYIPQDPTLSFYRGRGCAKCSNTGFRGRTAIFEVLPITDDLRSAISMRVSESVLSRKTRRLGFKFLPEAAVEKALQGVTSLDEALSFLPAYEKKEDDLFSELADFIDTNQTGRLLVVKSEDLARKIQMHASPEDYVVLEPSAQGPGEIPDQVFLLPEVTTNASQARTVEGSDADDPLPPSERRGASRVTRDFIGKYRSLDPTKPITWESIVVKNLGVGGCYFRAPQALPVGKELDICVQLPVPRELLPMKGVVRHCRTSPEGKTGHHDLGVSFKHIELKSRNQLQRAISFFLNKKPRQKDLT